MTEVASLQAQHKKEIWLYLAKIGLRPRNTELLCSSFLRRYVLVVCRFPAPIHAKVWYFCKCTYLLQNCIFSICKQKCKWRGIIIKLVHKSNFSHFRSSNSNNFSELASIHQTFVSSSRRKKADTVTQFYYIWGDCCVRKKRSEEKIRLFFWEKGLYLILQQKGKNC